MILPLLACLTLVGASSAPLAVSSLPYGNESLPQCVVYDDANDSISFESGDFNYVTGWDDSTQTYIITDSYPTLPNLAAYLFANLSSLNLVGSSITVEGSELAFNNRNLDDHQITYESGNLSFFVFINTDNVFFRFSNASDEDLSFSSFVWSFSSPELYEGVKTALQTDLSSSGMSGVEVVNEIVDILAGGLTSLGSSIGAGVATFAQSLAFTDGHLSVYFILVIAFAGVALAVGLTTLIFRWLTNLGN